VIESYIKENKKIEKFGNRYNKKTDRGIIRVE
jgi:hypothetical protein